MGCRCCKMIQSYIFDPQEVPTSEYISEINNYKSDESDGARFKIKHNNDIQVHKNELQNSEVQTAANRNKLNNTKYAVQNHRGTAIHEEGLGNSTEKCNGVHSHPILNTNQSKDINSTHTCSSELSNSSAKGVSQPQTYDNYETQKTDGSPKLSLGTVQTFHHEESQRRDEHTSPIQGAIGQSKSTHLSRCNYPSDVGRLIAVTDVEQSIESKAMSQHGRDLPSWVSKSCDSGLLNPCFEDKMSSDTPFQCTKRDAESEAKYEGDDEVNGELEEEDADVAEALAALEAATAGEDSEEEEENY